MNRRCRGCAVLGFLASESDASRCPRCVAGLFSAPDLARRFLAGDRLLPEEHRRLCLAQEALPVFSIDAEGIRRAEILYGAGSDVAREIIAVIHEAAARRFGRLLGSILEDFFPC